MPKKIESTGSAIEDGILALTGISPQKKNENRQKFLIRVIGVIGKLPDDRWEALDETPGAQDWYNKAIALDNEGKVILDFPDLEEEEVEEEEVEEEEGEEEVEEEGEEEGEEEVEEEVEEDPKKKKAASKKAASKKAAAKPAATSKKAAAKPAATSKKTVGKSSSGRPSQRYALKLLVVKKPKITVDELIAALEKKGYESPSRLTVNTTRSETRDTIRVIRDAGIDVSDLDL